MSSIYRIDKKDGTGSIRIRIPAGVISANLLKNLLDISLNYGNGEVYLTTRQGVELRGLDSTKLEIISEKLKKIFDVLGVNVNDDGSPITGVSNIIACVGKKTCSLAVCDTLEITKNIEKEIFPSKYNFKIGVAGCVSDCIRANTQDFAVVGLALPEYRSELCVGCGLCMKRCKGADTTLRLENNSIMFDRKSCVGCGYCIRICPTKAFTQNSQKYYKLAIMGRLSNENARFAKDWLLWITEENIIQIIKNTNRYIEIYDDGNYKKKQLTKIFDKTGLAEFEKIVLKDVKLTKDSIKYDIFSC